MNNDSSLMVLDQENLPTILAISNQFGLVLENCTELVKKYGIETIETALVLKQEDGIDFKLGYFLKIVDEFALSPVLVADLYRIRDDLWDCFSKTEEGRRVYHLDKNSPISSVSIKGLAQLAKQFENFSEEPVENNADLIRSVCEVFSHSGFRFAVKSLIERAQDLGYSNLEDFLEVMEDYSSGRLFERFFPDSDLTGRVRR